MKEKASKYRGVYKCGKKWKAQIQIGGIQHYLGVFDTEDQAAHCYHTFITTTSTTLTTSTTTTMNKVGQDSYGPPHWYTKDMYVKYLFGKTCHYLAYYQMIFFQEPTMESMKKNEIFQKIQILLQQLKELMIQLSSEERKESHLSHHH